MNVWATGYNIYGQLGLDKDDKHIYSPEKLNLPAKIKKISAGNYHSLLLDTNDQVWACGLNYYRQLPIKHTGFIKKPQLCEGLPPIRQICAGYHLSTFVDVDGKVWKCGGDRKSALKLQEGLEGIRYAECTAHSIFLDSTGNVWVEGPNSEGQLGLAINHLLPDICPQKLASLPELLVWEQERFQKTKSARN